LTTSNGVISTDVITEPEHAASACSDAVIEGGAIFSTLEVEEEEEAAAVAATAAAAPVLAERRPGAFVEDI